MLAATGPHCFAVVLVAAPVGWLAADLGSGLLHWACDSFGSASTPVIGQALMFLAASVAVPLASWPWLLAQAVLLCIALGALFTNQCHKWAHMDEAATPAAVRWAQRRRLVLPRDHHRLHHTAPFDSHFCMSSG